MNQFSAGGPRKRLAATSACFLIVILVIITLTSTQLTTSDRNLTEFPSFSGSRLLPEAYANPGDLTINTERTFGSLDGSSEDDDHSANVVLTVNGKLTIGSGGSITCNDPSSPSGSGACPIKIVVGGNMEMQAGSAIYAENRNDGGDGGQITIEVGGDLTLLGGAIISSSKSAGCSGCSTGIAGNIIIRGTGADSRIVLETGSQVLANGPTAGGAITITADHSITIDGLVSSKASTGRGMPITIDAGCDLTISDTGVVRSKGENLGADLVHLEGGCDVVIHGLVESTGVGHGVPTDPPNHCDSASRPGKPSSSTTCVEVWAGDSLTIDSDISEGHGGEVSADGGPGGRGWIDLFARGDITIDGDTSGPFAVHADRAGGTNQVGGDVTVKSTEGKVAATALAISADGYVATAGGGIGGWIIIEAKLDVLLDTASLYARGDFDQSGSYGFGGKIGTLGGDGVGGGNDVAGIRSYNGFVSWQNGVGDVKPTGTDNVGTVLPAANRGEIIYQNCTGGDTTGTSFPNNGVPATTPTALAQACSGAPTLPDYVVLPVCQCGTIVVEKRTIPSPDGSLTSFSFSGDASGSIKDGETIVVVDLATGTDYATYYSTEAVPPLGWKLTSIDCNDTTSAHHPSSGDVETRTATFNLEPDEVVKCTFTDTKLGTIIVEKKTIGGNGEFEFTGKAAGEISDGEQIKVENLEAGTYTSTETVPDGWKLTDITCDDANSFGDLGTKTATFNLEVGEVVKCTFTNEKSAVYTGSITIIKDTKPDDPQDFSYTTTGLSDFSLDDDGDITDNPPSQLSNTKMFTGLGPGGYSVTETLVAGFDLTDLSCIVDGVGTSAKPIKDPGTGKFTGEVSIELGASGAVTCTYENTKSCKWCTKSAVLSQVEQNVGKCCATPDIIVDLRLTSDTVDVTKLGTSEPATGSLQAAVDYIIFHGDLNGDGALFIGVTAKDCGTGTVGSGDCMGQSGRGPYGHGVENVVIKNTRSERLNVFGCSVDLTAEDPSKPVITIKDSVGKVTVLDIHVMGSNVAGYLIEHNGDLIVVKNGRAMNNGVGYWIKDDEVEITGSPEISGNGVGLQIVGNSVILRTNNVVSNKGVGIDIQGDNNVVRDEDVEGNGGGGIAVKGNYNEIKSNDVFLNHGDGINVAGDFNMIITNDVGEKSKGNNGDGIHVEGNGNTLDGNGVFGSGGDGIEVRGSNNVIKRNDVGERDKGNGGDGLYVVGAGNSLEENDAFANGGNGIHVSGGTKDKNGPNVLKKNRAGDKDKGNGGNGIWVEFSDTGDGKNGKVEIAENTAKSNKGVGIKVDGTAHQLTKNVCESNVGVEYYLEKGNFDSGGNKANGKSVSLKIPGNTGT